MKLFIKRFLLIIIGIILSLIVLECGLRLAGWVISSYQQYKNNKALKNKSQYTIMCLGESTTADQYPVQLQEILDKKYPKNFSVIDCGIVGTNLETILDLLDTNIKKYNPDVAICMMGINNNKNFTNIESENTDYIMQSKKINLKIIKLFLLIKQYLKIKNNLLFAQDLQEEQYLFKLACNYNDKHQLKKANMLFNKVLELSEKNSKDYQEAYTLLIVNYLCFMNDSRGVEMAINAIKWNYYDKERYYSELIKYFVSNDEPEKLKMIIFWLLNEKDFIPHTDLYNNIKPYLTESENSILLKKILSSYKDNIEDNRFLAMYYLKQKDYKKAKKYFDKAEEIRLQFPDIETYNLYKLIIKKLVDNNIKVICMQYPVRSIKSLQEQLKQESYYDKITFISNEKLFKDALMKKDYDEIFEDQFVGDFGHCTSLGNILIAKNVVRTLEKILYLKEKTN